MDMCAGVLAGEIGRVLQEQTVFSCKYRTSHFWVKPFGLVNAAAMLQRTASSLFRAILSVTVYIDDVVVRSKSIPRHISHLVAVC